MNAKTLQMMREAFLGRVCSIFTKPMNRSFDEVRWREHFVVRVQDINSDGIWGTHPYNNTVNFFRLDHIVFLQEEIELDPTNPVHRQMMEEYEKKSGKKIVSDVSPHLAPVVETPKPVQDLLPILDEKEEPQVIDEQPTAPDVNATFVNIDILESLANETKRIHDMVQSSPKSPFSR